MCGRYVLPDADAVGEYWAIARGWTGGWFRPRYNVTPTARVPILAKGTAGLELRGARWGLVPEWWKGAKAPARTFNARAEEAADKPAWRESYRRRRCLMPAMGWYEWSDGETVVDGRGRVAKRPYYVFGRDGGVLAFAGVWTRWASPGGGTVETCAMLTKPAAAGIAFIHGRMPVVLKAARQETWMDPAATAAELEEAVEDAREDFAAHPVGLRVNDLGNDDPELMAVAAGGRRDTLF